MLSVAAYVVKADGRVTVRRHNAVLPNIVNARQIAAVVRLMQSRARKAVAICLRHVRAIPVVRRISLLLRGMPTECLNQLHKVRRKTVRNPARKGLLRETVLPHKHHKANHRTNLITNI